VKLTAREARAVWPGSYLVEDEMEKIDYSKIDFSRCELPRWNTWQPVTWYVDALQLRVNGSIFASKNASGKWFIYANGTLEELTELDAICQKVDDFIASELARIKLEEEYPMSAEQAREFLRANPGEHLFSESANDGLNTTHDIWYRHTVNGPEWSDSSGKWRHAEAFDDYRYRLIESRYAKRVVKMTCLELCRRMVAEPRREFTIKSPSGDSVHRFDPVFCVFQWHNGKGQWFLLSDGGLHSKLIDVELSESETVKVEKPETVELGDISVDNCGWWSYGNLKKLEQGKWRITATRMAE
jgi:hypothetical protein